MRRRCMRCLTRGRGHRVGRGSGTLRRLRRRLFYRMVRVVFSCAREGKGCADLKASLMIGRASSMLFVRRFMPLFLVSQYTLSLFSLLISGGLAFPRQQYPLGVASLSLPVLFGHTSRRTSPYVLAIGRSRRTRGSRTGPRSLPLLRAPAAGRCSTSSR